MCTLPRAASLDFQTLLSRTNRVVCFSRRSRVGKAREPLEFLLNFERAQITPIEYDSGTYKMEDEDGVVWVHRTRNLNRNAQNCH